MDEGDNGMHIPSVKSRNEIQGGRSKLGDHTPIEKCQKVICEDVVEKNGPLSNHKTIEKEGKLVTNLALVAGFPCKSIRIGSYKCNMENYKKDIVRFEEGGMMLKVPPLNANYLVKLKISRKHILKISAYLSLSSPLLFLQLSPQASRHICREVEALVKKCDYDKIIPYFDACSSEESVKYLTICPNEMQSNEKEFFLKKYSDILDELDKKSAYDMLLKTSPKKFPFNTKFPPDFCPTLHTQNAIKYCQYPPRGSNCISVTVEDYCCLEDDVFLNDSIIDFYLRWLQFSKLRHIDRDRTHIFSTFFYKRLTMRTKNTLTGSTCKNSSSSADIRYDRVKRWTKNVNIFEKDFVIIPINQHSHWFVAVICFPGCEPGCYDFETGKPVKEPCTQQSAKHKQMQIRDQCKTVTSIDTISLLEETLSDYDEADALESEILELRESNETVVQGNLDHKTEHCLERNQISISPDFDKPLLTHEYLSTSDTLEIKNKLLTQGCCSTFSETWSYTPSSPSELDEDETLAQNIDDDVALKPTETAKNDLTNSPTYSSNSDCDDNTNNPKESVHNTKVRKIKQPCILIFDSLQTKSRAKVAATLREYLKCEYKSKIGDKERNFTVENLPGCCPKVPQQDNSSDCGVYLLQYIESFFENPLHTYELPYFEAIETPEQWFLTILVKRKRESIAKIIRHLTAEQNQGKEYVFPKIIFSRCAPPRRNSGTNQEEQKSKTATNFTPTNSIITEPGNYTLSTNLVSVDNPSCTLSTGENGPKSGEVK